MTVMEPTKRFLLIWKKEYAREVESEQTLTELAKCDASASGDGLVGPAQIAWQQQRRRGQPRRRVNIWKKGPPTTQNRTDNRQPLPSAFADGRSAADAAGTADASASFTSLCSPSAPLSLSWPRPEKAVSRLICRLEVY